MYTLIQPAKLTRSIRRLGLADTLSKIAETPQTRLGNLLPWNWMSDRRFRARPLFERGGERRAP
jgi:transposase